MLENPVYIVLLPLKNFCKKTEKNQQIFRNNFQEIHSSIDAMSDEVKTHNCGQSAGKTAINEYEK